jgi:hypothetical protein
LPEHGRDNGSDQYAGSQFGLELLLTQLFLVGAVLLCRYSYILLCGFRVVAVIFKFFVHAA